MTVASLYARNRGWVLALAEELDDSDEGRLAALVVLWQCCREYDGGSFKKFARPRVEQALRAMA